jgi:hypothetical protein
MQASSGQQGEDMGSKAAGFIKKILPYALILIGFLTPLITIIVLSTNVGTPDSNQEIRKYVAISAPVIVISMILLAVGSWIYFSRQPEYIVYFAITAAIFAIGMSSFSLCISMIDKQIS